MYMLQQLAYLADALLMDGSLECKFLAYFGTISLTVVELQLTLHPLLKGVHVLLPHMSSTLQCALAIPQGIQRSREGESRNVKISAYCVCTLGLFISIMKSAINGFSHHDPPYFFHHLAVVLLPIYHFLFFKSLSKHEQHDDR